MRVTVDGGVEPLFYAALRMSLVALILVPKLKWHKGVMRNVLIAGACYGGFNYAFMFPAMGITTASAAAIAIETYVPFSIILSVIFLGERIGLPRIAGIVLAFAGVALISLAKPPEEAGTYFVLGVALMLCSGFSEAVGAVMVKTVKSVGPLELLAWFAIMGSLILWPLSFALEDNQMAAFKGDTLLPFLMALTYSVVLVSIVAHASYYWLLQRLPIYQVAGAGLMTTVVAVLAGIVLLGEPATWPLLVGAAMTICGVTLILLRDAAPASKGSSPNPLKPPQV